MATQIEKNTKKLIERKLDMLFAKQQELNNNAGGQGEGGSLPKAAGGWQEDPFKVNRYGIPANGFPGFYNEYRGQNNLQTYYNSLTPEQLTNLSSGPLKPAVNRKLIQENPLLLRQFGEDDNNYNPLSPSNYIPQNNSDTITPLPSSKRIYNSGQIPPYPYQGDEKYDARPYTREGAEMDRLMMSVPSLDAPMAAFTKGRTPLATQSDKLQGVSPTSSFGPTMSKFQGLKGDVQGTQKLEGLGYSPNLSNALAPMKTPELAKIEPASMPKKDIDWGKRGQFALQIAPMIYNLAKGLQKPEKVKPNYNPYESQIRSLMANRRYNIDPQLNANMTAQAVNNRNIRSGANSRGEMMSNLGASQNYRMQGDSAAWAQKNNMDNQYMAEQAQMDYGLGTNRAQMDWGVQDAQARNKAATNQFTGQAFNDAGKFGQTQQLMANQEKRDAQLLGLYPDMFGVYNHMYGAQNIVNDGIKTKKKL